MTSINLNALNFFTNIQFPKFSLFYFPFQILFNLKSRAKLFQVHFYQTTVIKWNFGTRNHLLKGNGTSCAVRRLSSGFGDFSFAAFTSHARKLSEGEIRSFCEKNEFWESSKRERKEKVGKSLSDRSSFISDIYNDFYAFQGNFFPFALPRTPSFLRLQISFSL